MDENDEAREPDEQAATAGRISQSGFGYRREDWPDPLREPYEPAQHELDLLYSWVPGHRWNGWRRLTGDEDYYAACSCGWRSTETVYVSPMLRQVQDHLDAVRAVRGWRPTPRTAHAPEPSGPERGVGQDQVRPERARELYAAAEKQQRRLSEALEHSTDLLSASEEQADRLVAALQHAAAGISSERAKTEELKRRADRAKELRDHIVAAAGAVAAITEEIALLNQPGNGSDDRTPES